jgi:hypothetical protein
LKNNLYFLVNKLAKKNKIQLDQKEIAVQLLGHPYYPSLNCITELFDHFNVENLALKTKPEMETYNQLPHFFLAQINDEGHKVLVVVSKLQNSTKLIYSEKKKKEISISEFIKLWTGVMFMIEKPKFYSNHKLNKTKIAKNILLTITTLSIGVFFFLSNPTLFQTTHFLLSFLGLYTCYQIIQQELGIRNLVLDRFCSRQSKIFDCNLILNSKMASIQGLFKLSDVGLVYFSTMVLYWLFKALNQFQTISAVILLSLIVLPLTFISIYYQKVVVKSWCLLCLTIIGVLWLQTASLILVPNIMDNISLIDFNYTYLIVSICIVVSIWIFIKPLLEDKEKLQELKIMNSKFRRNFTLFNAAHNLNPLLNTSRVIENEIVLGNKGEENLLKIVLVTNPMCSFCKESHQLVQEILNKKLPEVQIIIRFNVRVEAVTSKGTIIAAKLLELYNKTTEETYLRSLSDIYSEMDANTWLKKWGEIIDKKYLKILRKEKVWCAENKINFTPAIIINEREYPKNEYNKIDLLYFLGDLIEEKQVKNNTKSYHIKLN